MVIYEIACCLQRVEVFSWKRSQDISDLPLQRRRSLDSIFPSRAEVPKMATWQLVTSQHIVHPVEQLLSDLVSEGILFRVELGMNKVRA